jgi:microcin C transport system substrate-binding protein
VIFSFEAFKKYSPQLAAYYRHVVKVEKTGDREITFTSTARQSRTAADRRPAHRAAQHWWEGTDKNGKKRDVGATTLEPPLGSAPTASRNSRPAATSSTSA